MSNESKSQNLLKKKRKKKSKKKKSCSSDSNHSTKKNDKDDVLVNIPTTPATTSWMDAFKTAAQVQPIIPIEEEDAVSKSSNILPISRLATSYLSSSSSSRKRPLDNHESLLSQDCSTPAIPTSKEQQRKKKRKKNKKNVGNKHDEKTSDHKQKQNGIDEGLTMDIGTNNSSNSRDETTSSSNCSGVLTSFPYPTEEEDHCESPKEAYEQIAPLLQKFASLVGKTASTVSIYDPYYCNGSTKKYLNSLGFDNVYHEKEDCYAVWNTHLDWDVLMTNPPYSGDHMERLLDYVTGTSKAWFLLAPQFLHKKDYYIKHLQETTNSARKQPFYLVPKKRYVYIPPKGFRTTKKPSDTHKKSSPFNSMWYIFAGNEQTTEELICWYYNKQSRLMEWFDIARSKNALRDLRRKA